MAEKDNLYDVLGIDQTATRAEIRAAGKKKKIEHHPDVGGDPEKFKEVGTALSILLDPAAKADYDRTGKIGESSFGEDNRKALAIVEQKLAALINAHVTKGFAPETDPCRLDVPQVIRKQILDEIAQGEGALPLGLRHKAFLEDFQRRLKIRKKGLEDDLLRRALQRQIELCEENIALVKEQIRLHRLALALIDNYSFEQKPASWGQSYYSAAPSPYAWIS